MSVASEIQQAISSSPSVASASSSPSRDQLITTEKQARDDLLALISDNKVGLDLLLRLAWHDAGTYDAESGDGGPNGSIRLDDELNREENKDLKTAVAWCRSIKEKNQGLSYADVYQLAGTVAIEKAGGPKIPFQLGRKDSTIVSPPNRLLFNVPKDASSKYLRDVFNRMGFGDKEIVALSWTYTLGERFPRTTQFLPGTTQSLQVTTQSLQFDNSFFMELQRKNNPLLEKSPLCKILASDIKFQKYVILYSKINGAFVQDYAIAHRKLSELGFKYFPNYVRLKHSVLFATTITILVAFLGYCFEVTRR